MTGAKELADKYIERGGYQKGKRHAQYVDDIAAVGSFLAWMDKNEMSGGERAGEAFLAFCRLMNIDPIEFRKILRAGD